GAADSQNARACGIPVRLSSDAIITKTMDAVPAARLPDHTCLEGGGCAIHTVDVAVTSDPNPPNDAQLTVAAGALAMPMDSCGVAFSIDAVWPSVAIDSHGVCT